MLQTAPARMRTSLLQHPTKAIAAKEEAAASVTAAAAVEEAAVIANNHSTLLLSLSSIDIMGLDGLSTREQFSYARWYNGVSSSMLLYMI